jgi:hypothetical protein
LSRLISLGGGGVVCVLPLSPPLVTEASIFAGAPRGMMFQDAVTFTARVARFTTH